MTHCVLFPQAQKARGELYAKEGEVKFLKDSLHKQEAELERLRAEREEWYGLHFSFYCKLSFAYFCMCFFIISDTRPAYLGKSFG